MAVSLTSAELGAALRLSDSPEEQAEATRLLAYVTEAVTQYAPDAPDAVHNESAIRLAGYLYDMPFAGRGEAYANALRNSGAARMLLPYRIHSVGTTNAVSEAQSAVGTTGNPVVDVDVQAGQLVITFADGTTESHDFPTGGIDTVAVQALIDVHAGMAEIHHMQGGGGGGSLILGNLDNGRLPGPAIAMRMGWGQTNPPMADVFVRDGPNHHPQDGAAVGTSELTYMPPFPPSLVGEHTLFVFIWLEGSPTNVDIVVNPGLDNQGFFTAYFTDGDPLEVEGVAGTVYVSLFPFSSNESLGFASPRPGPLLATQTWVTSEIANIMLSGGGISTGQAQALIDTAVADFETATEIQAIVAAAITALPDAQTLADANATAIDTHEASTHNTDATARADLATHEATPHGGGGGGISLALLSGTTLNGARTAFSITDSNAIVTAWQAGTISAVVLLFQDNSVQGTRHNRIVRIPRVVPLHATAQEIFHLDYGNQTTTVDHDIRLLALASPAFITVNVGTGQTFTAGETLTIYGES